MSCSNAVSSAFHRAVAPAHFDRISPSVHNEVSNAPCVVKSLLAICFVDVAFRSGNPLSIQLFFATMVRFVHEVAIGDCLLDLLARWVKVDGAIAIIDLIPYTEH